MAAEVAAVPAPVTATAPAVPGPRPPLAAAGPSLFVGDLSPDVTEAVLFNAFREVAPVASVRVCRNALTRDSLGYAYVNLSNPTDCERVIKELNYKLINDRPCRIMITQRDPGLRRSHVGNVFVKNLAESLTTRELYETFSVFGSILSCKIPLDVNGSSKGYGFVHFASEEAAAAAVRDANDMQFLGRQLSVAHYVPRPQRQGPEWNNVFVKNLPAAWGDRELLEAFKGFGEVISAAVQKDESGGKSKGFGFVSFREHDAASRAVEGLHDKEIEGEPASLPPHLAAAKEKEGGAAAEATDAAAAAVRKTVRLFVSRALKKAERERALRERRDAGKRERDAKFANCNLYVRNFDDSVDDAKLRETFTPFGTITSATVQRDATGRSRLFGYVCFATAEEAAKAQAALSGKIIQSKPLYVAPWQSKEQRLANNARRPAAAAARAAAAGAAGAAPAAQQQGPAQPLAPNAAANPLTALMSSLANPQMQAFFAQMTGGANPQAVQAMMMQMMMLALQQQQAAAAQAGMLAGRGGPQQQALQSQQAALAQQLQAQQRGYPVQAQGQQMLMAPQQQQRLPQQQLQQVPQQQGVLSQQQALARGGAPGGRAPAVPGQQGMLPQQQAALQQAGGARVAAGPAGAAPRGAPGQGLPQQQAALLAQQAGLRGVPAPAQQQPLASAQRPSSSQMLPGARNPATGVPPPAVPAAAPQQAAVPAPAAVVPDAGAAAESFTARLASVTPAQARHMIGERLFALIAKTQPERAGKITGMLLEGIEELSELLHLLESPSDLAARVQEALEVLARAGQA